MTSQPPDEPSHDRMETSYETGDLPVPGPLSPEARERVLNRFDELAEEQKREQDDE